jgi:hypothetical protein
MTVIEVDRPDRKTRRSAGKSDPIDAEAAARAAASSSQTRNTQNRNTQNRIGHVEALRNLRVIRRCAISHRADCLRRIKTLIITAPEPLRSQLRHLSTGELVATWPHCARVLPDPVDLTACCRSAAASGSRSSSRGPAAPNLDRVRRNADREAGVPSVNR